MSYTTIYELSENQREDLLREYSELNHSIKTLSSRYDIQEKALQRELEYAFSEGDARNKALDDIEILNGVIDVVEERALAGSIPAATALCTLLKTRQELTAVRAMMIAYYERDLIKAAMRITP